MTTYERNFLFNMSSMSNNNGSQPQGQAKQTQAKQTQAKQTQAKQTQAKQIQAKQPISKMSLVFSDKKQPSVSFEQFRQARLNRISASNNSQIGIWSTFLNRAGRSGGCGSCSGVR